MEACGLIGHLVVAECRTARLQLHPFFHWRAACRPNAPVTAELLAEFQQGDSWEYTPASYHDKAEGDAEVGSQKKESEIGRAHAQFQKRLDDRLAFKA